MITNFKIPFSDFKSNIRQRMYNNNKCQSIWEKQTRNKLNEIKPNFNSKCTFANYSRKEQTQFSKAVVPVLVLLFVALWFILRDDLLYVFPCVILFLCFSVFLVLRLPRLGKRELILVLFVRCSVCACLDLSVSSSSWGLGRAAVCDCGTPWTFLLPFFPYCLR